MKTICDTHTVLFWANEPKRLSQRASSVIDRGRHDGNLAISDISFWEMALLHERGRLQLPETITAADYMNRMIEALRLEVLPILPEIAIGSRSSQFQHGDPADRIIAATAIYHRAPLVTADQRLRTLAGLEAIW